ncbi:NAD(P)H nitroreductase [Shewanella gelidii]|uniref:Putative NAD(P)H nitroreductase n=1 Tax=Shewanella gelidii TaxID=1642821 RepID=A0A917NB28_9GAMM|nr:NAD(P)H nitroreductase [Shewanella gelidii]MCL1098346.1 NAD(P)H nitroreductase [Shewanella gelidii]GGI84520.1 nitroreductase [Shewanella gelidii]
MDALQLLHTRQSCPRLTFPAPDENQLKNILDAGIRVPDHANLCPWEFVVAQGEGLNKLSAIFKEAAMEKGLDGEAIERVAKMPHRAPMLITVIAKVKEHPKVPILEQYLAAGCAVMAMQQAAVAQGLGAIWRTGEFAFDAIVNKHLEVNGDDQIIGFLYLGTPAVDAPVKVRQSATPFVRYL